MDRIGDRMTPDPIRVTPDVMIAECARRMIRHHVRHLPVCDAYGRVLGMVQDADVHAAGAFADLALTTWVSFDAADEETTARQLVSAAPTVGEEDDLDRALAAVRGRRAVAVTDTRGRLVGIFTEHDGVVVALERLDPELTSTHEGGRPVQVISWDQPAVEALRRMANGHLRHLVATDGTGRAVGIVSRADLWAAGIHLESRDLTVGDVIGDRPLVATQHPTSLRAAAASMVEARIGCIPILDRDGRPVEVVTRTDLIEAALASVEEAALFPSADDA